MSATSPFPLLRALHDIALRAYPASFRARFGDDLDRAFLDRLIRSSNALTRLGLTMWCVSDAVVSGWRERRYQQSPAWPDDRARADGSPDPRPYLTWTSLIPDLRLAVRRLWRTPRFAALAVLTLALGLGANAAIFNVVHAVLLTPLPYRDADRLVIVWSDNRRQHEPHNPVSPANIAAFRDQNTSFSGLESMYSFLVPVPLGETGKAEYVQAATVSLGMFGLLGREAMLGRTLQPGDPDATVVISYALWQRLFNADPGVVGHGVTLQGFQGTVRVIGVMPEDFVFPYRSMLGPSGFSRAYQPDLWLPLSARDGRLLDASGQPNRTIHYLAGIARLKAGVSIDRAEADLSAIAGARASALPDTNRDWGVTVRGLQDQTVSGVRSALLALTGGAILLLLVAIVNVASLVLARATAEERDFALRSALGASTGRLVQQALVEAGLLALIAGGFGLVLMFAGQHWLLGAAPRDLARLDEVRTGATVIFTVFAATIATALGIGVLPAWWIRNRRRLGAMRDGHRATASRGRTRLRAGLVVSEVALATTLTLGAVLLLRSFVAVLHVNPGFDPAQVLTFQMNLPQRLPDAPSRLAFYDDLEARLAQLPGVTHVGGTTRLPLGSTLVSTVIGVEGRATPPAEQPEVELRRALFDYFAAMRMPILRGRAFERNDGPSAPLVALVNDAFVARVFPGEEPLGRRVSLGGSQTGPWLTIVGVVGNVHHGSLEERPRPEVYIAYRQNPPVAPFIVIRSTTDAAVLTPLVRSVVRELGADAPYNVLPLATVRFESLAERRFVLLLIGAFGALALMLAALGVYGIVSLVVAERGREVAVRLALGATPSGIARTVLRDAISLVIFGLFGGIALAATTWRWLNDMLFGVRAWDPATHLAVAGVLIAAAVVAAVVPARRAMAVDPAVSLR